MKQKTVFWVLLFAVLAAAGAGFYLLRGAPGMTAEVYVDGELYTTLDLSGVAIPYELTVETEWGYNVLRVSRGAVEVARADCGEQVCVNQGAIHDSLLPIVCLPHRLVIRIEDEAP